MTFGPLSRLWIFFFFFPGSSEADCEATSGRGNTPLIILEDAGFLFFFSSPLDGFAKSHRDDRKAAKSQESRRGGKSDYVRRVWHLYLLRVMVCRLTLWGSCNAMKVQPTSVTSKCSANSQFYQKPQEVVLAQAHSTKSNKEGAIGLNQLRIKWHFDTNWMIDSDGMTLEQQSQAVIH